MCRAKHYTEQLLSIFDNINKDIKQNYDKLTESQNLEQDILHIMENKNFNAYKGMDLNQKIIINNLT